MATVCVDTDTKKLLLTLTDVSVSRVASNWLPFVVLCNDNTSVVVAWTAPVPRAVLHVNWTPIYVHIRTNSTFKHIKHNVLVFLDHSVQNLNIQLEDHINIKPNLWKSIVRGSIDRSHDFVLFSSRRNHVTTRWTVLWFTVSMACVYFYHF